MGWRPEHVRGCSYADFASAVNGWVRAQGGGQSPAAVPAGTRAELEALMAADPGPSQSIKVH